MKLFNSKADIFVPHGDLSPEAALARVTHLCVTAHQDDIEIMAHAGICDCLDDLEHRAFGGVVVTNGAGSPRTGAYAKYTDEEMQQVRRQEQRNAATLGQYQIQLQLAHSSADVKTPGHPGVASDLDLIFSACRPSVVYLHNPADKHDTHVGVLARCIEALRRLPVERRPQRVVGCEVWRGLDWMLDTDKVALDSGRRVDLADKLLKAFDSQIAGGKRYDYATAGRRAANATYHASHNTDQMEGITWAVDLTPLMQDDALDLATFTTAFVQRLEQDIAQRIRRVM